MHKVCTYVCQCEYLCWPLPQTKKKHVIVDVGVVEGTVMARDRDDTTPTVTVKTFLRVLGHLAVRGRAALLRVLSQKVKQLQSCNKDLRRGLCLYSMQQQTQGSNSNT